MKRVLLILALVLSIVSCKKSMDAPSKREHAKTYYRIASVKGTDTIRTPAILAREQTVGLILVEDNTLKAELMSFQSVNGVAYYTIKMTNKTDCRRILRWNWEELGLTSIEPDDNTANTPQSDVLNPNEVKTYIAVGLPKLGRIKVKAEKLSGECENSTTLVINITMSILPVTYLKFESKYDEKTGTVNLMYLIDDPNEVDTFIIEKLVGTKWVVIYQFTCDKKTTFYNIPIFENEAH